jgi:hypothetical protein
MKSRMLRTLSIFLFIVATACIAHAQLTFASVFTPPPFLPNSQIIPVPNSAINYTQVMFDHPPVAKAVKYVVSVYEGQGDTRQLLTSSTDSSTSTRINKFSFGKSYSWHYTAVNSRNKTIYTSAEFLFTVLPLPSKNRVRVTTNDYGETGGLISFDYHCMIVDRTGTPVWFLPSDPKNEFSRDDKVRDLRVSTAGTITFITQRNAFEIMPDGRISWRAPKTGVNTVESLHHGIERLPNGHLMTLGNHTVRMAVPFDTAFVPVEFGVIVEYDRSGNIVWKWDSYPYMHPAEIDFVKQPNGQWAFSTHMNAFRQVKENGIEYVYAGFRDIDRVIKIEKSSGKVVAAYGRQMNGGYGWYNPNLFHAQHDVTPLSDGNIAVFNNDSVSKEGVVSSVVIFSPGTNGNNSKLVWRFACDFDNATTGKSEKCGSVDELPNKNLLVNFGNINRTVEMTRDGKIVWDAFTESYVNDSIGWVAAGQYRSHYCSSLYPIWFSVAPLSSTKTMVTFNIWNDGDDADNYSIQYQVGEAWISVASVNIDGRKHKACMIPKGKTPFYKIKVTSATNPDFVRTLDVYN